MFTYIILFNHCYTKPLKQFNLFVNKDAGDNVAQNEINKKRVAVTTAEDNKSLTKVIIENKKALNIISH